MEDFRPLKRASRATTAPPKPLQNQLLFKVFGISQAFQESFKSQDSPTKNLKKQLFFNVFGGSGLSRKLQEPRQPHQNH